MPSLSEVRRGHHSRGVFVNDSGDYRRPKRQRLRRDIVCSERYNGARGRVENDQAWIQDCEIVGDVNKTQ